MDNEEVPELIMYHLDEKKTVPLVVYDVNDIRHVVGIATIDTDGRVSATFNDLKSAVDAGFDFNLGPCSISLSSLEMDQEIQQYRQARYISDQHYPEIRFDKDIHDQG